MRIGYAHYSKRHLTRARNGIVKLSLFVQNAAQKSPVQLTAVTGVQSEGKLPIDNNL